MLNHVGANAIKQVRNLLTRSHTPRINVQRSEIAGAGKGVYLNETGTTGGLGKDQRVLCLYPGVYTPGLPSYASSPEKWGHYLANDLPPSGISFEDNAYILNLQKDGGYIDGCPLTARQNRRLDANPSACGHLINHNASSANVEVVSFLWRDIIEDVDIGHTEESPSNVSFPLPNVLRDDGTGWYLDGLDEDIVRFPDSNADSRDIAKLEYSLLCGAAIVSKKHISPGDELLLEYGLLPPYPRWAAGWYEQ
jgi:hypothetical protein